MNKGIPAKHFYIIRHGQTEANAQRVMAGVMETPLTTLGRQQARDAQEVLKRLTKPPKTIIHSQLSRARDTANILNEVLDLPMHEDPDWGEFNAGDWEGQPYEIVNPLFTGWCDRPNGEKYLDFFARVAAAKKRALTVHDAPVMIVCHGGVMRALGGIWGRNTPGRFENAHLYEFMPHGRSEHFPWDVYHYRYCETSNALKKEKSELYAVSYESDNSSSEKSDENSSASKIA